MTTRKSEDRENDPAPPGPPLEGPVRRLVSACLERPTAVTIASLALVALGALSLLRLPVALLPQLERPALVVLLEDPEAGREDLLLRAVEPLERRLMTLPGVLRVESWVGDGTARLVTEAEWQTDPDTLRIDAERRLAGIDLGNARRTITMRSGDSEPVLSIVITGGRSAIHRARFTDRTLVPELATSRGAGDLHRTGGATLRPVVRPHAAALAANDLSAHSIALRLESIGESRPIGRIREGGERRALEFGETVRTIEELARVRVYREGEMSEGPGVALGDLAQVALESVREDGLYRYRGRDAVLLELWRGPGQNAVRLARDAKQKVASLKSAANAEGIELQTIDNAGDEVEQALLALGGAALLGLFFATVILRLLLGAWLPTLVLAVIIPASLAITFGLFLLTGTTLDIVALAGLALAIGLLVDNSIVVLEAIAVTSRRGKQEVGDEADAGVSELGTQATVRTVVATGVGGVAAALVGSFLTTAAIFIPLIYLRGLARAFFGVQAFAIVGALLVSLLLSLTLLPVIVSVFGRGRRSAPRALLRSAVESGRQPLRPLFLRLLRAALRTPRTTVVFASLVALVTGGLAYLTLPRALMPGGPAQGLEATLTFPGDLDEDAVLERMLELEANLVGNANHPWSLRWRTAGLADPDPDERENGLLRLVGEPDNREFDEFIARTREALLRTPGLDSSLRRRGSALERAFDRSLARFEIDASAPTPVSARQLADRVLEADATQAGGARLVERYPPTPHRTLHLRPGVLGKVDAVSIERQVGASLGGIEAGRLDGDAYPDADAAILLEATEPRDPARLPVVTASVTQGGERAVPLGVLAVFEDRRSPAPWFRVNGRPSVRIEQASGAPLHEGALELRPDETLRPTGTAFETRRSFRQLGLALGLGLVLMWLTLAALQESLVLPLATLLTLPIAIAGGLTALLVSGQTLNVASILGLVLLSGIVVNNSIVLLFRMESHWRGGASAPEAALLGARERYRPILMTSATTVAALLPLAIAGAGIEASLAVGVIGGLLAGFIGSLIVSPATWALLRRASQ